MIPNVDLLSAIEKAAASIGLGAEASQMEAAPAVRDNEAALAELAAAMGGLAR